MRGSNQRRIRSEITVKVHSDDDEDVGTAARTRPLSYDEIMLRRKNRKALEHSNDRVNEVDKLSSKETTRYDSVHIAQNDANIQTDDVRASYTRRRERASRKETENDKSADKDIQELESKSGKKVEGQMNPATGKKMGKDVHHRSNEKMENFRNHRSFEKIEKEAHHKSGERLDKDFYHRSCEKLNKDVHHRSGENLDKGVHHRSRENLDKDVHHRPGKNLDKDVHHRSGENLDKDMHHRSGEKVKKDVQQRSGENLDKDAHHRPGKNLDKDVHHRSGENLDKDMHHRSGEKVKKDVQQRSGENLDKDVPHRSGENLDKDMHHRSDEKVKKDVQQRSGENLDKDVHHRSGEKLNKDLHHRLGESLDKDVHNRSSLKLDKDVHHKSTEKLEKNRQPRLSSKVEKDARHHTSEKKEDDTSYRASKRTEKDTGSRLKHYSERDYDKSLTVDRDYDKITVQDQLRNKSDNGNEKKHHRDHQTSKIRKTEREATTDREYKRKDRSGDDAQHMDKHAVKKRDSGQRLVSEKERIDSSNSRHEETRLKRRRSKSPEHNKDRGRTSGSFSPRARKYSSSRGDELHPEKDRSNGSGSLYHRHGGASSGLGGYSPRKRKTDAAVRTPSPLKRSPENRSAGLEQDISGSISIPTSSAPSALQLLPQAKPAILVEPAGAALVNLKALTSLPNLPFANKVASIDSVQLTQATRPLRRLYVDNVPSSASEKDIMDCFNGFLLSAGANQIQRTKPCISCMIHKEKGQALVEFLTPEDASAALALDSRSFYGSTLNVRRPKDFVEMANDFPERSKAGADAVSDIVKNSPHKIFVGGFSDTLSPEQLLKILHAFGPLKAFHFEVTESASERCAFLEYVDQSVTLKACAALNGMKLGGGVLTAAQAFPDASILETYEDVPCYEIPKHVKTLLEKPTEVLKLKNVVDPLTINLLSESDLEEILEDVRQECTRFGAVKSINIVKTVDSAIAETQEAKNVAASSQFSVETAIIQQTSKLELDTEPNADEKAGFSCTESERKPKEEQDQGDFISDPTIAMEAVVEDTRNSDSNMLPVKSEAAEDSVVTLEETIPTQANGELQETITTQTGAEELGEIDEKINTDHIFEAGCMYVEFKRTEASCIAAHCLHGRLFDSRTVTIEYVPHHLYKTRFSK